MREIKFRAWYKPELEESHKMGDVYELSQSGGDLGENVNSILVDAEWVVRPPAILMQYTGLKDKNGKEAYFQDLVKLTWLPIQINYIGSDGIWQIAKDNFGIPVFMSCGAKQGVTIDFKDFFFEFGRHDFEVVGNVYENPELLEEKPC